MDSSTPALPSPSKRRHKALTNSVPRAKRVHPPMRIKAEPKPLNLTDKSENLHAGETTFLYAMDNPGGGIPTVPVIAPTHALPSEVDFDGRRGVEFQLADAAPQSLAQRARALNIKRNEQLIENKGTKRTYTPRVAAYEAWWNADQERLQDEARISGINIGPPIPAHPITVAKVSIFMDYECKREKHKPSVPGETIGISSIKATISALEHHRRLHADDPEYKNDQEAQISLRSSHHINTIERLGQAREPERLAESQELKKYGVHSQTFSESELRNISIRYFQPEKSSDSELVLSMRDRAMLLFSTSFAFRGDNTRGILMSDLLIDDIPMLDIGPKASVKALLVFSNNGKTNPNGRIDILATFRHSDPLYCAFGALGFYFFSLFHVQKRPKPEFAPDFSRVEYGVSGYRDWYKLILFATRNELYKPMSADNHRKRFNEVKFDLDLYFKKVTHAGRPHAATTAIAAGASVESVKAVGLWSTPGSFSCYNSAFPIDAMVALAGFNGRCPESYFVSRSQLDPPAELLRTLFPWVEAEQLALKERISQLGRDAFDASLTVFLRLLEHLRAVILQDAAVLFTQHPTFPIFEYAPFNTPSFRDFAAQSVDIISDAELSAQARSQNLPHKMASIIKGVLETSVIHQEETKNTITGLKEEQAEAQHLIFSLCKVLAGPSGKKRQQIDDIEEMHTAKRLKSDHRPQSVAPAMSTAVTPLARLSPPLPTEPVPSEAPSAPIPPPVAAPSHAQSGSAAPPPLSTLPPAFDIFISGAGNAYSSLTFPMDMATHIRSRQMAALTKIEGLVSPDVLKRHRFFWDSGPRVTENWVPVFETFWKPSNGRMPTYSQIWDEYEHGIGGNLSVKQLDQFWGARWRHSDGVKQEYRRRMRIIELIKAVGSQDGWDEGKALRHIEDQYQLSASSPVSWQKNLRAFVEHLQKCKGDFSFFLNASQNTSNAL